MTKTVSDNIKTNFIIAKTLIYLKLKNVSFSLFTVSALSDCVLLQLSIKLAKLDEYASIVLASLGPISVK